MYEFTVNGIDYIIEFELQAYIFADIYIGRIYDVKDNCIGVIIVNDINIILKRVKSNDVKQYIETHTDSIAEFANCI